MCRSNSAPSGGVGALQQCGWPVSHGARTQRPFFVFFLSRIGIRDDDGGGGEDDDDMSEIT